MYSHTFLVTFIIFNSDFFCAYILSIEYLAFILYLTSAVSLGFGDTLCWLKAGTEGHVPPAQV